MGEVVSIKVNTVSSGNPADDAKWESLSAFGEYSEPVAPVEPAAPEPGPIAEPEPTPEPLPNPYQELRFKPDPIPEPEPMQASEEAFEAAAKQLGEAEEALREFEDKDKHTGGIKKLFSLHKRNKERAALKDNINRARMQKDRAEQSTAIVNQSLMEGYNTEPEAVYE